MAKDASGLAPISEESIGYLEEVKKGKPRKFAMICKGTSVISLVVYKKGNVEKHKKEAKQSGKGQFYFGVVDGKGIDLRFVLARADGFESAPVKPTSLKGFLDESAQLKCKPYFEIVDATPLVLDEDDPLVARFSKLQVSALEASNSHPDQAAGINTLCRQIARFLDQNEPEQAIANLNELELLIASLSAVARAPTQPGVPPPPPQPPTADSGDEAKLLEALKKFKPLLAKAIELNPNRKNELMASIGKIRDAIKNKQFADARGDVIALGKLLQSLVAPPPAPSAPAPTKESAAVLDRLKALAPEIKTALAGTAASRVQTLVEAVKGFVSGQDFVHAGRIVDELRSLLATATTSSSSATPASSESASVDSFKSRLKGMLPDIKKAQTTGSPDAARVGEMVNEVQVLAKAGDFAAATVRLVDLEKLVRRALAPALKMVAPERWAQVRDEWKSQLDNLMNAAEMVGASLEKLGTPSTHHVANTYLQLRGGFPSSLQAALNAIYTHSQAGDEDAYRTSFAQARRGLKAAIAYLWKYQNFIRACEVSPFMGKTAIVKPLNQALQDIGALLAKA